MPADRSFDRPAGERPIVVACSPSPLGFVRSSRSEFSSRQMNGQFPSVCPTDWLVGQLATVRCPPRRLVARPRAQPSRARLPTTGVERCQDAMDVVGQRPSQSRWLSRYGLDCRWTPTVRSFPAARPTVPLRPSTGKRVRANADWLRCRRRRRGGGGVQNGKNRPIVAMATRRFQIDVGPDDTKSASPALFPRCPNRSDGSLPQGRRRPVCVGPRSPVGKKVHFSGDSPRRMARWGRDNQGLWQQILAQRMFRSHGRRATAQS